MNKFCLSIFLMFFTGIFLAFSISNETANKSFSQKFKNSNDEPITKNDTFDQDSSKRIGEYTLRLYEDGVYRAWNIEGYSYIMRYPLILNKKKLQGGRIEEIIIYKNEEEVDTTIDLKKLNPYLDSFENINYGLPSFEAYSKAQESYLEEYRKKELSPSQYFTRYIAGITYINGYSAITYDIIPTYQGGILDWKSTTYIIDRNGKLHSIYSANKHITPCYISEDGKLFAYVYGTLNNDPFPSSKDGYFIIKNLETSKVILQISPSKNWKISRVQVLDRDYLRVRYLHLPDNSKEHIVDLININERKRYHKIISRDDFENLYYDDTIESDLQLIDIYNIESIEF